MFLQCHPEVVFARDTRNFWIQPDIRKNVTLMPVIYPIDLEFCIKVKSDFHEFIDTESVANFSMEFVVG